MQGTQQRRLRKLAVGERVRFGDFVYRVGLVNSCRARLDLVKGGPTSVREFDAHGAHVRFEAPKGRRHLNVSPYSLLERVEEEK